MKTHVYFIHDPGWKRIKIGSSDNLIFRLYSLQSVIPRPLKVLGIMDGGKAEEDAIRDLFPHLKLVYPRKRGSGHHKGVYGKEWCKDEQDLLAYIAQNARPWDRSDTSARPDTDPVLAMQGSPAWLEWVEQFAASVGVAEGTLVDQALAALAAAKGLSPPPPR